ncbi:cation-translocating P-type ATPase [Metamycoplasma hyosynoviae]|uniref:Cation-translocating P-type ATPase n=1 Tax=Metamycoplasma hyosynoviae TaxID=29559 RepID=A0AAP4AKJ9_9BACT|nr:cation-translocating P-type ATPase [Metamycoplasma hyosynoviae]MDD7847288.1 cation-translocating P-type ATPase [Metamycoplasma hyosynoviae]MDD7893843.1 cation-translocating P-type ATPase [Metamycoplasma hyosynoviae]MDI3048118.1 cation-translocating P-type ATPase [Metamycoplasma hyosynoviae]MDI3102867.1 cation-translocating P-type ATPase [Metamycoplasma hyosynoviae]MDI3118138.1 cation-translocating P-type ATPase [Metamycoplasma hyosynoviae]
MINKNNNVDIQSKPDYKQYINTNINTGLTDEEVSKRQKLFGKNTLREAKKKNPLLVYLEQFKDLLVLILLFSTLLSYIMAIVSASQINWVKSIELTVSFIEPTIILIVILINSFIGAVQEIKSEKAINALRKLNSPNAKVKRNGQLITLPSDEIVVGDIIFLDTGDIVPADGYILSSKNLNVIESSLTGESEAVEKHFSEAKDESLPIAEQKFALFSSSIVSSGNATYIVTKTGINSEIGKISNLVSMQKQSLTPLQRKITKLGKIFAISGIVLFLLSVLVQIIFHAISKGKFNNVLFWSTTFINGVSLAVAAIPEGLVAFTSIILAIGVQKMAQKKAIIKNLMSVETLGSCSIICSDKTGTLTENKMTVVDHYSLDSKYIYKSVSTTSNLLNLFQYASLCSEANIVKELDSKNIAFYKETGDPTEIALLYALEKNSDIKTKLELDTKFPRLFTLPFDSDRKLMTSINKIEGENVVIVKGAPDILLSKCNNLNDSQFKQMKQQIEDWSNKTYRVLALAIKKISDSSLKNLNKLSESEQVLALESTLQFVGMLAMIDPPRQSSKDAIEICKAAHIKPIMITGDSINTAIAIAKELGIYSEGDTAISGQELIKISDEELIQNIDKYSVYARVAPEDKLRIVHAWQAKNQVVAMTGDGVNDAPALKAAEIGCAMGITGTEASKQAADMILVDDNFSTIVSAVENGRSIYQKIKNVIQNLLITSIAEIILVFFGLIIFKAVFNTQINEQIQKNSSFNFYILGATQLLWINLFTHGFPAIALGLQESKENYMKSKPISKDESIFANKMGINTLWQGILIGILSLVGYYLGAYYALKDASTAHKFVEYGSTCAFLILGISATFNAINLMSKKPFIVSNPLFYWKIYLSVFISLGFLFIVSFIKQIAIVFKITEDLTTTPHLLIYGLCLPLLLIPIYQIHKVILLAIEKHRVIKASQK